MKRHIIRTVMGTALLVACLAGIGMIPDPTTEGEKNGALFLTILVFAPCGVIGILLAIKNAVRLTRHG